MKNLFSHPLKVIKILNLNFLWLSLTDMTTSQIFNIKNNESSNHQTKRT